MHFSIKCHLYIPSSTETKPLRLLNLGNMLCAQKETSCIVYQISGTSWLCIDCLGGPDLQLSFLICNLKSRQRLAGGDYRTQLTAFSPRILMLMHFCNCIISMDKITIGLWTGNIIFMAYVYHRPSMMALPSLLQLRRASDSATGVPQARRGL